MATINCPTTLECPALPRVTLSQAVIDLMESIALQESALSHILCAESQKMKTALAMNEIDLCKLLEVNEKGEYVLAEPSRNQVGSNLEPQDRDRDRDRIEIGKDRDSRESSRKRNSANNSTTAAQKLKKPTLEELKAYIAENGYTFSAEAFMDYYESNGWKVGRNPMKSWQATCRTWQRHELPSGGQGSTGTVPPEIDNIPF